MRGDRISWLNVGKCRLSLMMTQMHRPFLLKKFAKLGDASLANEAFSLSIT